MDGYQNLLLIIEPIKIDKRNSIGEKWLQKDCESYPLQPLPQLQLDPQPQFPPQQDILTGRECEQMNSGFCLKNLETPKDALINAVLHSQFIT